MIRFFVAGLPVPKGSHRAMISRSTGRAIVLPDADRVRRGRLASWQACVRVAALAARAKAPRGDWPTAGPVALTTTFYLPRPKRPKHPLPITKPDTSKLLRAAEDGLTGVLFLDDGQVTDHHAKKRYAGGLSGRQVGVWVEVRYLDRPTADAPAPCLDGARNGDRCTACDRPLAEHRSDA